MQTTNHHHHPIQMAEHQQTTTSTNTDCFDPKNLDFIIKNNKPLINIIKLIKSSNKNKKPYHYNDMLLRERFEEMALDKSCKYINSIWAINFMISKDNVNRNLFLIWMATILENYLIYNSPPNFQFTSNNNQKEHVNLKNISFQCEKCGSESIIYKGRKRKPLNLLTPFYKNQIAIYFVNIFISICTMISYDLWEILGIYLSKYKDKLRQLLKFTIRQKKRNNYSINKSLLFTLRSSLNNLFENCYFKNKKFEILFF
ncbi:hypothetical protein ABK040_010814 [Willaertia magna]